MRGRTASKGSVRHNQKYIKVGDSKVSQRTSIEAKRQQCYGSSGYRKSPVDSGMHRFSWVSQWRL